MQTPVRIIQRHRIRIIAELEYQAEQNEKIKAEQEEAERESRRMH